MLQLDVRILPPSKKHSTIHECLEKLDSGDTLRIINDHDPRPLRYELDDEYPGGFAWTYIECGPALWQVDISKKHDVAQSSPIDIIADSNVLRVGDIRVDTGESRSFDSFGGTAELLFRAGEGTIVVSGCSHAVKADTVELVCPGEPCTISASTAIHVYLVVAKDDHECAR